MIVLILVLSVSFTLGCWDRKELEDQAFVQAIGIDKGQDNQLLVTFRIAIPSKAGLGPTGAGGGGGGGVGSVAAKSSLLTTVAAPTIPAAITLASGYVNRELNLMHTKVFIFGEPFARQGVGPLLSILSRYRELRRNIFVCVAKGEAFKLLAENTPDLEKSFTKYWEGVKLLESRLAINPGSLFHEFAIDTEALGISGTMMYLAENERAKTAKAGDIKIPPSFMEGNLGIKAGEIPRTGGNPIEYIGTAVFKGDKFTDVLNLTETQSFLMLTGNFNRATLGVKDPLIKNRFIPFEIKQGSPPIVKVDIKGDRVKIKERLSVEGDLVAIQGPVEYATDLGKQKLLQSAVEKHLEEQACSMVKRLQKRGIDMVGYGDYAKRNFLTRAEWNKYNWPEKFKEAEIDLKFVFRIRRIGLQGRQPEIHP